MNYKHGISYCNFYFFLFPTCVVRTKAACSSPPRVGKSFVYTASPEHCKI